MQDVEYEVRGPVSDETLVRNVQHALSLGLPEFREFEYPWAETLQVVGSGPSALLATLGRPSLAVNGALRLFNARGVQPTYWAGCDPQEHLADFLADAPADTTYLLASKCDPRVFEVLQGQKRNIVLWHVADDATWPLLADLHPVQAWTSVTISAFELMARLGWRKFDVWGWDGCVLDGRENAVPQANGYELVTVETPHGQFTTSHNWIVEAQSAAQALAGFPFPVHVRGPGMMASVLRTCLPRRVMTDHQS